MFPVFPSTQVSVDPPLMGLEYPHLQVTGKDNLKRICEGVTSLMAKAIYQIVYRLSFISQSSLSAP